jgi:hypothetical protein
MSVASAVVRATLTSVSATRDASGNHSTLVASAATWCLATLTIVAPFESLHPLMRLPGQSFTTVEVALLTALTLCGLAFIRGRAWRALPLADAVPWAAFVCVAAVAAASAPEQSGNALRMAARIAIAAILWGIAAIGTRDESARRRVVGAALVSGAIVAVLVIADFAGLQAAGRFLASFRAGVAVVGAQVRASGPFQYPTIASMYLEMAFALGLGLLVSAGDRRTRLCLVVVLAVVAEAIVLTFTRSGLLTMAVSLSLVAVATVRQRRRAASALLAALALLVGIELLSSRSAEMLMLRFTSEGQGRWFSAVLDVPSKITLDTRTPIDVPITVTNTGRATWDSEAANPIRLSYHWVAADSDDVIAWEGIRTPFDEPVRPGRTVSMNAQVGGPGRPGRFRLLWDIEQEHRLWFSTEPDSALVFSDGVLTGPMTSAASGIGPHRIPRMAVRPGRLVLWGAAWRMFLARPLLGVGPDNYRLLYGRYSTVREADPRVHSNNMYIEVLAGMGLLGAAALAWIGVRIARDAIQALARPGLEPGIAAACLAIAVHGLADSFLSFTGTYILIAVTLGLASASAFGSERHAHRV